MSVSLIQRYFKYLPLEREESIISLGEGHTPLIQLSHLMEKWQNQYNIFAKVEGLNPTGSFKDRGMTVALSKAKEEGAKAVLCASTGNTSAACAAYAAKAGLKSIVLIPEGKIAQGKLAQAIMYGAEIIQIKGNFDDAMTLVKELSKRLPIALMNSVNPHRIAGQKTAAFEIIETLGDAPDYHYLPVGNAGNLSAYWMGYEQYYQLGKSKKKPIMRGIQAEGAAPFMYNHPIKSPETIATAIRIGNPQSWELAKAAVQDSKGRFDMVSDNEILSAQKLLSEKEGIFCEPASAASIAGLINHVNSGKITQGSKVVCTLTGNGLKDPDIAISQCTQDFFAMVPDLKIVQARLEKSL